MITSSIFSGYGEYIIDDHKKYRQERMGKRKGKRLYCFFAQWCYKHKGFNKHIVQLKRSLNELEETLGKCPVRDKKKK